MSIEAMKQALEALDNLARYADTCELFLKETHPGKADALRERVTKSIEAITSLRQAIEQAEKQEPVAWMRQDGQRVTTASDRHNYPDGETRYSIPLYPHPQPQREQVVYQLSPTDIYDFAGWLTTRKGLMQVGGAYEAGPMAEAVGEYLKTFPERFATAQREWVGLTDEETDHLFNMYERSSFGLVRAVEAKLKEKNT